MVAFLPAVTWLRRPEIFALFATYGFSEDQTKAWLARAIEDRRIVCDRPANPETDLFRLDRLVGPHYAWRWRPDVTTIDWDTLMIFAPPSRGAGRPFGEPNAVIEASAGVLRKLLGPVAAAATVAGETRAIAAAAERLRVEPRTTKRVVVEIARGFGVTLRGAELRVWPEARKAAGLPAASAGRKSTR